MIPWQGFRHGHCCWQVRNSGMMWREVTWFCLLTDFSPTTVATFLKSPLNKQLGGYWKRLTNVHRVGHLSTCIFVATSVIGALGWPITWDKSIVTHYCKKSPFKIFFSKLPCYQSSNLGPSKSLIICPNDSHCLWNNKDPYFRKSHLSGKVNNELYQLKFIKLGRFSSPMSCWPTESTFQ